MQADQEEHDKSKDDDHQNTYPMDPRHILFPMQRRCYLLLSAGRGPRLLIWVKRTALRHNRRSYSP